MFQDGLCEFAALESLASHGTNKQPSLSKCKTRPLLLPIWKLKFHSDILRILRSQPLFCHSPDGRKSAFAWEFAPSPELHKCTDLWINLWISGEANNWTPPKTPPSSAWAFSKPCDLKVGEKSFAYSWIFSHGVLSAMCLKPDAFRKFVDCWKLVASRIVRPAFRETSCLSQSSHSRFLSTGLGPESVV